MTLSISVISEIFELILTASHNLIIANNSILFSYNNVIHHVIAKFSLFISTSHYLFLERIL